MIKRTKTLHSLTAALAGLTLAGTSMGWAAGTITDTFDSGISGWTLGNGTGTVSWNPTNGNPGGCLQVVGTDPTSEADPIWAFPSAFNSAQYMSVQFDIYVDPASGTAASEPVYGYVQPVLRNATQGWGEGFGWTGMDSSFSTGWHHMSMSIPASAYDTMSYLLIQLTPNGSPFSAPATYYIDNVTITPFPDPWVLIPFTDNSLAGSQWDSTKDCPYYNPITKTTTNFLPAGSYSNTWTATWQWQQLNLPGSIDLTRYQNIGFDLYLDGPTGGTKLGGMQLLPIQQDPNTYAWSWPVAYSISFTESMVGKWTHFDFAAAATGNTNCPTLVFSSSPGSDNGGNNVTYHIDNVELWTPVAIPKFDAITPTALAGGVHLTVNGAGDQYDRNQLCIPAGSDQVNYFWTGQEPATYSMTISNFPSPATAPGFEGHIYIVNEETDTGGNETAQAPDWNCPDLAIFRVQNGTSTSYVTNPISGAITTNTVPAVVCTFEWKTNLPAANPPNVAYFTHPNLTSANGTWTLNFNSDTAGTIIAPDGTANDFTLPDFSQNGDNFNPTASFMNWGVFKNDNANSGINNGDGYVLTQLLVSNSAQGVLFTDNFQGPGLTANYAWRTSNNSYVQWLPAGLAYWLKWTLPDTGYSVQSAASVTGPWSDAGITYTEFDLTGANRLGAVPATSLPVGNTAFFRLVNTNSP